VAKSKKSGSGKKKLTGNHLLVLVLVGGALYVNWEYVKGLLPLSVLQNSGNSQKEETNGPSPLIEQMENQVAPHPGSVALYQPVRMEEEIPNPFGELLRKTHLSKTKKTKGLLQQGAKKREQDLSLPKDFRLSLVLLSGSNRSAVIGGRLVGLGDILPFGIVKVIEKDRVEIQGKGGRKILLPLRKAPLLVHFEKEKDASPSASQSSKPSAPAMERPKEANLPSVPQGPLNPADLLKVIKGFTPPSSQGKE
jgi:virulence-associated protein VagC